MTKKNEKEVITVSVNRTLTAMTEKHEMLSSVVARHLRVGKNAGDSQSRIALDIADVLLTYFHVEHSKPNDSGWYDHWAK